MRGIVPQTASHQYVIGASVLAGCIFSATVTLYAHRLGYPVFQFGHPVKIYPFLLLFVSGFVPVYLAAGYALFTPTAVLAIATSIWVRSETNPGPGDPFVGFIYLLPIWVVGMVLVGLGELRVRNFLS